MPTMETCIGAAIRLSDGTVIKGKRHNDCLTVAFFLGYDHRGSTQGFLTSTGRFVDREDGRRLQDAAEIPSADPNGYRGGVLFSEDLY